MVKQIPISQGKFTLVDDEDFEYLSQWKWHYLSSGTGYVARSSRLSDGKLGIYFLMHRIIMQTPQNMVTDHIDGNGLNNTKINLRICSQADNTKNVRSRITRSGYKGVWWNQSGQKWNAVIKANGRRISLGLFSDATDAAKAYNEAALKYFGEFANLNIIGC